MRGRESKIKERLRCEKKFRIFLIRQEALGAEGGA